MCEGLPVQPAAQNACKNWILFFRYGLIPCVFGYMARSLSVAGLTVLNPKETLPSKPVFHPCSLFPL
ncbi:MAG: hypothetical protein RLZZ609_109 [Cyanobacteriota bacterium]|jgi:hypothetical protein